MANAPLACSFQFHSYVSTGEEDAEERKEDRCSTAMEYRQAAREPERRQQDEQTANSETQNGVTTTPPNVVAKRVDKYNLLRRKTAKN
jgi:hypothetical protein